MKYNFEFTIAFHNNPVRVSVNVEFTIAFHNNPVRVSFNVEFTIAFHNIIQYVCLLTSFDFVCMFCDRDSIAFSREQLP
jgi:hypothetical protein